MIIRKLRNFPAEIESFVDSWGQLIVGDLENGGQAATEHVVRILEVI